MAAAAAVATAVVVAVAPIVMVALRVTVASSTPLEREEVSQSLSVVAVQTIVEARKTGR